MKEVVENFTDITGYNLTLFMTDYADFMEQESQSIVDFYSGNSDILPASSVSENDRLIDETKKIGSLFKSYQDGFNTSDYVDLIDIIGDIQVSLLTIQNSAKWTRSSVTDNRYTSSIEVDSTLKQNQTLEQLSREVGYLDGENDWTEIAIRNGTREEDYTSTSGLKLKVSLQNNLRINIQSVVDVIFGESIYGKDIQKKLEFENDDLKVLGYQETIRQAFEIALNLRRGDNPEFPDDGIQSSLVIGQNLNSVLYPSLLRQLYNTFSKDDTMRSIAITDIKHGNTGLKDTVELAVQSETRIGELIDNLIVI